LSHISIITSIFKAVRKISKRETYGNYKILSKHRMPPAIRAEKTWLFSKTGTANPIGKHPQTFHLRLQPWVNLKTCSNNFYILSRVTTCPLLKWAKKFCNCTALKNYRITIWERRPEMARFQNSLSLLAISRCLWGTRRSLVASKSMLITIWVTNNLPEPPRAQLASVIEYLRRHHRKSMAILMRNRGKILRAWETPLDLRPKVTSWRQVLAPSRHRTISPLASVPSEAKLGSKRVKETSRAPKGSKTTAMSSYPSLSPRNYIKIHSGIKF